MVIKNPRVNNGISELPTFTVDRRRDWASSISSSTLGFCLNQISDKNSWFETDADLSTWKRIKLEYKPKPEFGVSA